MEESQIKAEFRRLTSICLSLLQALRADQPADYHRTVGVVLRRLYLWIRHNKQILKELKSEQ